LQLQTVYKPSKNLMAVFIKKGKSFERVSAEIEKLSINDITEKSGYNKDELYVFFCDANSTINTISLEIFTNNIVFITVKEDYLDENEVKRFLKDFSFKEIYNSYEVDSILSAGIYNRSLTITYLARVLNIIAPDDNGLFFIELLGLNLFFIDGVLTDFQTSDGLSKWAKDWRELNPKMFKEYENTAKLFWGNNLSMIIKEINAQADAYASIPHGFKNEFIPLHRTQFGNINFFMLNICHYKKTVDLDVFLEINHGRYRELLPRFENSVIQVKQYIVDKFTYEFIDNGVLLRYYSIDN